MRSQSMPTLKITAFAKSVRKDEESNKNYPVTHTKKLQRSISLREEKILPPLPILPSFPVTAEILSFAGYQHEVRDLLFRLNKNA